MPPRSSPNPYSMYGAPCYGGQQFPTAPVVGYPQQQQQQQQMQGQGQGQRQPAYNPYYPFPQNPFY